VVNHGDLFLHRNKESLSHTRPPATTARRHTAVPDSAAQAVAALKGRRKITLSVYGGPGDLRRHCQMPPACSCITARVKPLRRLHQSLFSDLRNVTLKLDFS